MKNWKIRFKFTVCVSSTRCVSWSLPVFSIKKTLNSQGNLKTFLFKVLTIGFYTFCPSFRQIMDTIPKKLFLFQGKPFDEPFFDCFKIVEALLCEWVSHRCEKMIVGRVRSGEYGGCDNISEFNGFNVLTQSIVLRPKRFGLGINGPTSPGESHDFFRFGFSK